MKIKRLTIKNMGMIEDADIPFNHPLLLFYGQVCQGKTTVLNAVRLCLGGTFPADIIRHEAHDASVILALDNGSITREWYRAKDGTTKARPIKFIRDGMEIKSPASELEKFRNPFLLDQEYLWKMGETDRKAYFVRMFGADTTDLDKQILQAHNDAKELRAKIKGYGEIDITEVKPIDVASCRQSIKALQDDYSNRMDDWNRANLEANNRVLERARIADKVRDEQAEIKLLQEKLERVKQLLMQHETWLNANPLLEATATPTPPDTSALDRQVNEAAAQDVRVEQYQKNLVRKKERDVDEAKLFDLEKDQKAIKDKRTAKLTEINSSCKIAGLVFDDLGQFSYNGTTAGMLSGAQLMQLSAELSRLYPEGLGVGLIDRGESLGKSVFALVDLAKEKDETILVTVVGEAPAQAPEDVGVFVVENGNVKVSAVTTGHETGHLSQDNPVSAEVSVPPSTSIWND